MAAVQFFSLVVLHSLADGIARLERHCLQHTLTVRSPTEEHSTTEERGTSACTCDLCFSELLAHTVGLSLY